MAYDRLATLVGDVEAWCTTHRTSPEVGEALARLLTGHGATALREAWTIDRDALERIWDSPTPVQVEDVRREAAAINVDGDETLCWGEMTWRRGE